MHILRKLATASELRVKPPIPDDACYDQALGVWVSERGLLTYDPEFEVATKKNDVETGEDQKGA